MVMKPLSDLYENYPAMRKLCLSLTEPICFETKWEKRLILMNIDVYGELTKDYNMAPFGERMDPYDVMGYKEKVLIFCEETHNPVFVWDHDGKEVVFMHPILYNFLAGNP